LNQQTSFLCIIDLERSKMPPAAIHKSKDKKRKGGAGAENEYARRLQNLDENLDVPLGRITKMLRADRFLVSFYDTDKRQLVEVQASIVDRNIQRLKPEVGSCIVPVESGKDKYEIYLVLTEEDARRRTERIPKQLLNITTAGSSKDDDCGIEFEAEELIMPDKETDQEKKDKRDKAAKHVERVIREENDEVNVDDI